MYIKIRVALGVCFSIVSHSNVSLNNSSNVFERIQWIDILHLFSRLLFLCLYLNYSFSHYDKKLNAKKKIYKKNSADDTFLWIRVYVDTVCGSESMLILFVDQSLCWYCLWIKVYTCMVYVDTVCGSESMLILFCGSESMLILFVDQSLCWYCLWIRVYVDTFCGSVSMLILFKEPESMLIHVLFEEQKLCWYCARISATIFCEISDSF